MKLYHGTCGRRLKAILNDGIVPRRHNDSLWKDHPSRHDLVYLTTAYAFYFAHTTALLNEDSLAVVEIDGTKLNQSLLLPDEDYIGQRLLASRRPAEPQLSMKDLMPGVRDTLENYRTEWHSSVLSLGNLSYKGVVPVAAITRYCKIEGQAIAQRLREVMPSPQVTIHNFAFLGVQHQCFLEWLFGDSIEFVGETTFSDRTGITVTKAK